MKQILFFAFIIVMTFACTKPDPPVPVYDGTGPEPCGTVTFAAATYVDVLDNKTNTVIQVNVDNTINGPARFVYIEGSWFCR